MRYLVELTMMRDIEADSPEQAYSAAIETLDDKSDEWGIMGSDVVDISSIKTH